MSSVRERLTLVPSLDSLAEDPGKAADLPPEIAKTLYLKTLLVLHALVPPLLTPPAPPPSMPADRLLTPPEAAKLLGVEMTWIYRHAANWLAPHRRSLSRRQLRFSEQGLRKYLETRR